MSPVHTCGFKISIVGFGGGRVGVLSELGLRMVRFGNEEVMRDLSTVVGKIRESILK